MNDALDNSRVRPILWLLIISGLAYAILIVLSNSTDRYHQSIIESAGLNPEQEFNLVWTDYTGVGLDYSREVCLGISDIETSKTAWILHKNVSDKDAKVLQLASSFSKGNSCVGSNSQYLILNSNWSGETPYSWEILFLDTQSNRLLLMAGTI